MTIRNTLAHAVTSYDRKQSTRRDYNHYALGQYLMRVDDVCRDIEAGANPFDAINAAFCGPLLRHVTKTIQKAHPDLAPAAAPKDETSWTYRPVAAREA